MILPANKEIKVSISKRIANLASHRRGRIDPNHLIFDRPLLALSGHRRAYGECPLSGVKRTSYGLVAMSVNDPKRTSARPSIIPI